MDLRLLRYFLAVVDHGGINRAAAALHLSQPSLSQAIRTLEGQLGVTLFVRTGRGLTLSPQGESLVAPARQVAASVAGAEAAMDDARNLRTGRLHLAALPDLSLEPLASLIAAFRARHPGVLVEVHNPADAAHLATMVRQGAADVGLTHLPVDEPSLVTTPLRAHVLTVAISAALARSVPDPVPVAALDEIPLVQPWPYPAYLQRLRDTHGIDLGRTAVRCAVRHAQWELVRQGAGAMITSTGPAPPRITGVEFRRLVPRVEHRIGLAYRGSQLPPTAAAFLAAVRPGAPA